MSIEKYREDLERLVKKGKDIKLALIRDHSPEQLKVLKDDERKKLLERIKGINLINDYQNWYSEALVCIKQLLPSREDDFIAYYKPTHKRKKDEITYESYTIADALYGLTITRGYEKNEIAGPTAAIPKFYQQLQILESVLQRFESTLFDIKSLVQSDLLDSELAAAEHLAKNGFLRAAGAVAGVVLEKHLLTISEQHNITIKKNPNISDINDALKEAGVIDIPAWRKNQHLTDIRNLCDHKRDHEPTGEQIGDLIDGVKKVIKTLF